MRLTLREWIVVAVASLVCSALVGVNAWYQRTQAQRIATVDARAVLQAKHRQVSELLVKKDISDEERKAAVESAAGYPAKVDQAVEAVRARCRCVLVARSLVVAGAGIDDYTAEVLDQLRAELGR
ncbi:hypothetical protein [Ramlibacter humi]|uniref:hypothetical protein n=1 Tax=Ramlibacter humi TaxID=2530451 RepID=UPI00142F96AD|nr:hypothetical protein [Ramlibacter humi]